MPIRPSALLAAALLVLAGAAHADDAAVKAAIQKQYDVFAKAYIAKDVDTIAKLAAPGFTSKNAKGNVSDGKSTLESIKKQMKSIPAGASAVCKVLKVQVKGGKAVVDATEAVNVPIKSGDNLPHTITMQRSSVDTWTKVGGAWKALQFTEKEQKVLMDGKDLNPKRPGAAGAAGKKK